MEPTRRIRTRVKPHIYREPKPPKSAKRAIKFWVRKITDTQYSLRLLTKSSGLHKKEIKKARFLITEARAEIRKIRA